MYFLCPTCFKKKRCEIAHNFKKYKNKMIKPETLRKIAIMTLSFQAVKAKEKFKVLFSFFPFV